MRTALRLTAGFVLSAAAAGGAVAAAGASGGGSAQVALGAVPGSAQEGQPPSLMAAEQAARDIGPVRAGSTIELELSLKSRHPHGLELLLSRGEKVTPTRWAEQFGPAPAAVRHLELILRRAGLAASWNRGDTLLGVSGPAAAVESFFHIPVDRFQPRSGAGFYGPLHPLEVPAAVAAEVSAVSGASDYEAGALATAPGPYGLTAGEISSFYDMTPLRRAGLDGSGETVLFPEWAMPSPSVLAADAATFHLPPYHVTVERLFGGSAPGPRSPAAGEAALDLEVVHELAPGAKEVVYEIGDPTKLAQAIQTMVSQHPGAILSSSISNGEFGCEAAPGAAGYARTINAVFAHAAALGSSIFWAAGDRGAFGCLASGVPSLEHQISVMPEAASPYVTAVGGTTIFMSTNGAYFKEAAWGESLEQWGGGGGISKIFAAPSYQSGPGIPAHGYSGRGLPDVSADADATVSGWSIVTPPTPGSGQGAPILQPVGGTSAATPCWAAITALIDEDLHQQGLRPIGFANPALYLFARHPKGLPAPAFHQVTVGNNLYYLAAPGWNAATGLGTPDVAHLADDFEWYERTHH